MSIEDRILSLEQWMKEIGTRKKKDCWDIFQIVAGLLIPASIAFAGYLFSTSMKEAEIKSNEDQSRSW